MKLSLSYRSVDLEDFQQASKKRQQRKAQSRVQSIVAPVGPSGGVIPRNLTEVRRAIVMTEILGKPKAFE